MEELKDICTIMTPTYNRKYKICELYRSLKEQSNKEFEWLIIDDGSSDGTEEFIKKIKQKEKTFKIWYYKVKNGGKHRAINFALEKARGKYFFIVDSDDILPFNSVEIIKKEFENIKNENEYAGVGGLKQNISSDSLIGETFKEKYVDCTNLERKKYNILGDKAEVFYTDILKNYKFPEFENEKFLTEAVVWDKIGRDGLKIRWFNKVIYRADYLSDGLSKNLIRSYKSSPRGFALYLKSQIENKNNLRLFAFYNYGKFYNLIEDYNLEETAQVFNIKIWEVCISCFIYKFDKIIRIEKIIKIWEYIKMKFFN